MDLMHTPENAWERLLRRRDHLVEVCAEVEGEMDRNRKIRSDWREFTEDWKRVWLKKPATMLGKPRKPTESTEATE